MSIVFCEIYRFVTDGPEIQSLRRSSKVPICPGYTVMITCNASANPSATYSWIGPNSRNYSGATIAADINGVYTCTASNVIQGSIHSDTNETTLNVCKLFYVSLTRIFFVGPNAFIGQN